MSSTYYKITGSIFNVLPPEYQTEAWKQNLNYGGTLPPDISQDTFNAKHQRLSMLHVRFKIGLIIYLDVRDWLDVNKGYLSHLYVGDIRETLRLPPVTDSDVR
jgi:hypothetical protein